MSENRIVTVEIVHRLQIERVIRRGTMGADAEFMMGEWLCCRAWFIPSGQPCLSTRSTIMTPEQASAVQIALGMALDWIAEELAANGVPPCG